MSLIKFGIGDLSILENAQCGHSQVEKIEEIDLTSTRAAYVNTHSRRTRKREFVKAQKEIS